eukprot:CAMPEP_0177757428 /NCGR_PEP_ID=MMETSP0491_2-20121128/3635_1 /TAXON_ID=63592 /ORGANISM="Tetraselmis chuii, Strain PLY429" /LENGTH=118 /DNA_ID=CAMNT_0019273073 /DNA_START=221 /DNA_END=574 /DNA_ORIENTATION=-
MAASSKPPQGKTFSSRLKGMKFMQRAEEKKTLAAATKRKREDSDEARWAVDSGADSFAARRCVVLVENDPPPGARTTLHRVPSLADVIPKLQRSDGAAAERGGGAVRGAAPAGGGEGG